MTPSAPHFLLIEPYYGGSHRIFLKGMQKHVDARFTLVQLPARKWKMRMQLAAPWMAEQVISLLRQGNQYHAILCSTFLDVAVLRSLLALAGIQLPIAVYFHENQFSYPAQITDPAFHQFTAINFTTALTADALAFNSRYNFTTFLAGIRQYLGKATDMNLLHLEKVIQNKSTLLYPGIDFRRIDAHTPQSRPVHEPVIIWNHRWEHDKDPTTFFSALFHLANKNIPFKVIVLGEHFRTQPDIFALARQKLADRILHFGYAANRDTYAGLLVQGDIVVSTAHHEFFGIALLEGVRAGCTPLVPDRLAYQELFPKKFRYRNDTLEAALEEVLVNYLPLARQEALQLTEPYSWPVVRARYLKWLLATGETAVTTGPYSGRMHNTGNRPS